MERILLSEIQDFLIGQEQDYKAMTGCTAIIAPEGAVCGVDIRGGSPVTRDTAALNPLCNRKEVHAVMLAGGSSFGLEAAGGLMYLLEEKKIGRNVGVTVIPNVCSAILFDLKCGDSSIRPNAEMGRKTGENALKKLPFQSGNYGAGTGATLGTFCGTNNAMKGGIGCAAYLQGDLMAAAVIAVNCIGDIVENGKIIAGARKSNSYDFANSENVILDSYTDGTDFFSGGNTVIGCIMTNAILTKAQATKVSGNGQNAIARTVYPAHTMYDGDTIFTLSSGKVSATLDAVGILASHAVQSAIIDAVKAADTFETYLSYRERNIILSGMKK